MSNKKINHSVKIFTAIFFAFIVVKFFSGEIFLANTPRLRNDIGPRFISALKNSASFPGRTFARLFIYSSPEAIEARLSKVPFKKLAGGVYAKENEDTLLKTYKIGEVQWVSVTFTYKGKTYNIHYVAGDVAPDIEQFKRSLDSEQ